MCICAVLVSCLCLCVHRTSHACSCFPAGNLGLNGALPTLNLVIQQQEPEKVKSDVNVPNSELTNEPEPSETTAETMLTLSPDQEMNRESSGAERPPLASKFPSTHAKYIGTFSNRSVSAHDNH